MSVKDGVAEDVGTVGTLIGDPKFGRHQRRWSNYFQMTEPL